MKDKYTTELTELEDEEKGLQSKYFAAKSQLTEVQEELIKYRTSSNQFEQELEAVKKVSWKIQMDIY
jgi:phage shock protein A